ncbi:2,3,4,5-tetrahydropyridine-2,6-dicarboxylate N-succinyltransferase [Piscirickettsia litoralis]|uniref:2,3,4,5-tetrahydropyridine-2,6-dicarboxylate N-succinyltransferase n=1 Tax=Piscirickettsia litoralis TaxID=1891921 RepID=A0ABX3A5X6_9GAMM|nr:2,3,4,5-tetrahydropyridine-2,6-dicarboxylate N-succinyltransferase [Piscirickettsia litoralis]ODN43627.1 2,3,4,5-tetrahydropyridine-2,6-dicarboxylate N-succinyltransferase [Piscirickettsia litoralis]
MTQLESTINDLFERRSHLKASDLQSHEQAAIEETIKQLDQGSLRVAEKINGKWHTHEWLKKAVLLSFVTSENQIINNQRQQFYDKVPLKYQNYSEHDYEQQGVRIVPPATARRGAYIAPNSVLMPSYVNIGAYIDSGTMVDTWATVGSCAQIGKNVHLSGGVGIGGVLEPLQATPTIIEDNCFIGARSEIVEGAIVEENSVIGMGVFISQSTKIYDRENDEIYYGRVPSGSVVVAGSLPSKEGRCHLNCAVIVKRVDAKTRSKTSINELLRTI